MLRKEDLVCYEVLLHDDIIDLCCNETFLQRDITLQEYDDALQGNCNLCCQQPVCGDPFFALLYELEECSTNDAVYAMFATGH